MIKGIKIHKAQLDNAIDIYPLIKEAVKSGMFPDVEGNPTDKQMQNYYLSGLLSELQSPNHVYYIARRGRGFVGYCHAFIFGGRWLDGSAFICLDSVYVKPKLRKKGVGKAFVDEIKNLAKESGIKNIVLMAKDDMLPYWEKQGAIKSSNSMVLEV